jgi:2-keto-4-pentenoate hydratase/2-oxohepta-3-ene-1,7-dioic acid hydratase in catechol pathway
MKLLRYGPPGREKPGLADKDGNIRDLSKVVAQLDDAMLAPRNLARVARVKPETLPIVRGAPRLGVPYAGISKFVAIGLNYRDHAEEAGLPIPAEPVVFMKASTCLCGPNDETIVPKNSQKLDYEVELGIVIGTKAQYVSESKALDHVAGYCVVNDVSERHFQMGPGGQWDRGKGCDTFGPVGPWLVTTDEITDPQDLDLWLDVNGEKRQRGNTRTMIYSCAFLVSYVSQFMTLLPGDIITTGTPPGVALGMKPPKWLNVGDTVTLGIEGLGEQRQRVVAHPGSKA